MHSTDNRALRTTPMSSSSSGSGGGATSVIAVEALPSSCTWTRRIDATSARCVVQPRSCFSCLNTKPTSNETCTLTPNGICMGADAYDPARDYRRGGPAAAWPPHLNFFPAQNATYCEKNDTACATCRERSFMNWEANPSQYCEGVGGCVCVAICESDSWEEAIEPALQKALLADQANSSFANCTIVEVKTAQDNVTVASNLSDFVGLGATKAIYAGADQCMWVQNQTFCGAPRSCYDCLNTPIYSGARCMLHSSGYCTSMESYDMRKDFRYQGRSNNSIALFPSSNTSYCAASDATCLQCRQNQTFAQWSNVSSPPKFCVGNGGCVCVASCESPAWRAAVVDLTCNTSAVQKFTQNQQPYQLSPVLYWSVSALSLIMAMVCALLGLSCVRRCQQRAAAERRRPRSPTGPTLELSGWKAMREKLIETEREFIGETGAMAQLEGRRLRVTSADSEEEPDSGPDSNHRDSPSVPALVIEEGDAYRPASPSRMHQ